jgi:hypothetical protein
MHKKTVYRIRMRRTVAGRPAPDLLRERQHGGRAETAKTLQKSAGGLIRMARYRAYSVRIGSALNTRR